MPLTKKAREREKRLLFITQLIAQGLWKDEIKVRHHEEFKRAGSTWDRDWRTVCERQGCSPRGHRALKLTAATRLNRIWSAAMSTTATAFCASCRDDAGRPLQIICPSCGESAQQVQPDLRNGLGSVQASIKLFALEGPAEADAEPGEVQDAAVSALIENMEQFSTGRLKKIEKAVSKAIRKRSKSKHYYPNYR